MLRTGSPLTRTVAVVGNDAPVPVGSTCAVVTAREPSAPPLKSVAVTVNVPSELSVAAELLGMAVATSTSGPHGAAAVVRSTSARMAARPTMPIAGVKMVCALTEATAARMMAVVKSLANMFVEISVCEEPVL